MKHAFLITAYKYPELLVQLIRQLEHPDSFFFIHIDKKSRWLMEPAVSMLQDDPNIHFVKDTIDIHYGGFTHLEAVLKLFKIALKKTDITYFHTLSGQCFPLHPVQKIFDFFNVNNGKNFMEFFAIPDYDWLQYENGGWNRILYYHLGDIMNPKGSVFRFINPLFVRFQKKLKIKRSFYKNFPDLYAGTIWFSIHRSFLEYADEYVQKNRRFLKRLKHTFCSEEFVFQTIGMNSIFKESIVNDNLRYVDWSNLQSSPVDLDEKHFNRIMTGNYLFARKFAPGSGDKLLEMIQREIKEETQYGKAKIAYGR